MSNEQVCVKVLCITANAQLKRIAQSKHLTNNILAAFRQILATTAVSMS